MESAKLRSETHISAAYDNSVECEINNPCPDPCDDQIIEYQNTKTTITNIEIEITKLTEEYNTYLEKYYEHIEICPELEELYPISQVWRL